MSTDNPKQDLGFGCFPLIAILTIALAGIFIYPILTSSPVDYFKLFSTTVIFAVISFVLSPWFRPIMRGFPPIKFILVVIFAFIVIYPMLMHLPVDYFRLFIFILLTISFLFSLSPWLKPLLHRFPQIGMMHFPNLTFISLIKRRQRGQHRTMVYRRPLGPPPRSRHLNQRHSDTTRLQRL